MPNSSRSQRRIEARRLRLNLALESMKDLFFIHDEDQVQDILLDMFHYSQISEVPINTYDRDNMWIIYKDLRKLITAAFTIANG